MFCFPGKDNLYHLSLATLLYDDCLQNKIVVIQQEKTIQNNSRQNHFPRGRQVVSLDTRRSFCGILNKSRPWHIFPEAGQNCSTIKTKKIILNMKLPRNWIAVKKKVLTRTYLCYCLPSVRKGTRLWIKSCHWIGAKSFRPWHICAVGWQLLEKTICQSAGNLGQVLKGSPSSLKSRRAWLT